MNKLITAIALVSSFGASASMPCGEMHKAATAIMQARQAGMPIPQLVETLEKYELGFMQGLAIYAYDKPRYATEAMKQRSVTEFGNMVYVECKKHEKPKHKEGE